jgi:hypothetical protein
MGSHEVTCVLLIQVTLYHIRQCQNYPLKWHSGKLRWRQLSMGSNWGAHSTFPSFPVSLPSVKGRPAATELPALKLGKLNFSYTPG